MAFGYKFQFEFTNNSLIPVTVQVTEILSGTDNFQIDRATPIDLDPGETKIAFVYAGSTNSAQANITVGYNVSAEGLDEDIIASVNFPNFNPCQGAQNPTEPDPEGPPC